MEVKDFLAKNGFTFYPVDDIWYNNNCEVKINPDYYSILCYDERLGDEEDMIGFMYSINLNIYWLVGVLTWYGLIDKNYKQ